MAFTNGFPDVLQINLHSVSCGIPKEYTLVSGLMYLWHLLNLCILERFRDEINDDDIVYYLFGTTSRPAIASTSNLT
jgi:hypothetical protein